MEDRDLKKAEKAARKKRLAYGKRLLAQALNGFYYFDDDAIEDFIDKMDLRFTEAGYSKKRAMLAAAVLSHDVFREKICDVAAYVFGEV
jgi:hypothetical protein